jgi:hypothetical protein
MKPDSSPTATAFGIEWFQSSGESLGILVSPDAAQDTRAVTYFYNH